MGRFQFIEDDDDKNDDDDNYFNYGINHDDGGGDDDDDDDDDDGSNEYSSNIISSDNNGGKEDGEIVEEEENSNDDDNDSQRRMDIDIDCYGDDRPWGYNGTNDFGDNNHNGNKYSINDDDRYNNYHDNHGVSFTSYLPSFSGFIGRRGSAGSQPSPKPEEEEEERQHQQQSRLREQDHNYCDEDGGYNIDHQQQQQQEKAKKREYRLIASSKYDRNYDHDDFFNNNNNHISDDAYEHDHDNEHEHRYDHELEYNNNRNNNSNNHQELVEIPSSSSNAGRSMIPDNNNRNNNKNTNSEVHYHIYVSESQATRWFPNNSINEEEEERDGNNYNDKNKIKSRQRMISSLWKFITIAAFFTQLLFFVANRYDDNNTLVLPLPPPPQYLTWNEYRNHQYRLIQKLSNEGYSLLKHVVLTATATYYKNDKNGNRNGDYNDDIKLFSFPTLWTSFEENNESFFFGQTTALEKLHTDLNNWSESKLKTNLNSKFKQQQQQQTSQLDHHHHQDHFHHPHPRSSRPLVLYVSGGKSIGKRSLAYLLLKQLRQPKTAMNGNGDTTTNNAADECSVALSTSATNKGKGPSILDEDLDSDLDDDGGQQHRHCPLLHLTPPDYNDNDNDNAINDIYNRHVESSSSSSSSSSSLLYRRILDHVVAAGGGASIVLLERVDCFYHDDNDNDNDKEYDCNQHLSSSSPWLRDLMRDVQSQHAIFGSTIFILTSHVGTTTMEKWTRKRLQSQTQAQQQYQHDRDRDRDDDDDDDDDDGRRKLMVTTTAPQMTSEIESMLRYEIRKYHSSSSSNNNSHDSNNEEKEENDDDVNTGQDNLCVDDWLIIPMVPLDRATMKSVLGHIAVAGDTTAITADYRMSLSSARTSSSVLLTESATNRVLDALEWHQWIHKTTGEVLRIWSPNGTRPLLRLWKDEILDIIGKECYHNHNHHTATVQRQQILDFEETTMEQFVMRSCVEVIDSSNNDNNSVNNNNINNFNDYHYNDKDFIITTIDHRTWDCRRLIDKENDNDGGDVIQHASSEITCRFYL